MKLGSLSCALVTALALLAVTRLARADESEAEVLFRQGRALMLKGRFDEACPKIAESQRLDPHVGTLLNLAACHEKQGKVGSAWVEYQKALTAARAEGQTDRAKLAQERLAVLEPRVPWLRITVRNPPEGLVVTLDGGEIAPAAFGSEMPLDPGVHAIDAKAPTKDQSWKLDLREGGHDVLEIDFPPAALPKLEEPAPALPTPERVLVEQPPKPPAQPAKPETSRWVIEPALFLGYIWGSLDRPVADSTIEVQSNTPPYPTTSCDECTSSTGSRAGVAAGVNAFAGYAFSENVSGGLRLLVGSSIDGNAFALTFGPALSFRATSAVRVGFWLMYGHATFKSVHTAVNAPAGYRANQTEALAHGSFGGFGAGVEVSVRLADFSRGQLVANATPLFISGSQGTAFALPLGLAYRFQ